MPKEPPIVVEEDRINAYDLGRDAYTKKPQDKRFRDVPYEVIYPKNRQVLLHQI